MKRETLLEQGFSEEQVTAILNMFHNSNKEKEDLEKTVGDLQAQLVGYGDTKAKLDALEREKMTADEKLKADQEQVAKNLKESQEVLNRANVKVILAEIGETDEATINLIAKSDNPSEEAKNYVDRVKARDEQVKKHTLESMQQKDIKPSGSNVAQEGDDFMTLDKFNKLLHENYTKAKEWKDANPELYKNLS